MIETIRVDLHCHSSMSDGDHAPAYVAHSIAAIGAVWASLTDHNTLSGQPQFRAVLERRGLNSVVGLEMDARSPAGVLHLLGYGLDQHNEALLDALRTLRQPWRTSARHWFEQGPLACRRAPSSPASPTGQAGKRHRSAATAYHRGGHRSHPRGRRPRVPGPPAGGYRHHC